MVVPADDGMVSDIEQKLGMPIEPRAALLSELEAALGGEIDRTATDGVARRLSDPASGLPATGSTPTRDANAFREHTAADPTFDLVKRRATKGATRKLTPAKGVDAANATEIFVKKPLAPPPVPARRKRSETWSDETLAVSTHTLDTAPMPAIGTPTMRPLSRSTSSLKTFEAIVGAMRNVNDEQEMFRLACRAAAGVSRSVVYFEVRPQQLVGRAVEAEHLDEDRVRRVALPTDAGSVFRRPWALGERYRGACGSSAADAIYLSAIDGVGAHVHIEPVVLEGRVIGLIALDEVNKSPLTEARIEAIAVALSESLERLLSSKKR